MVIFHSYVSLPEGIFTIFTSQYSQRNSASSLHQKLWAVRWNRSTHRGTSSTRRWALCGSAARTKQKILLHSPEVNKAATKCLHLAHEPQRLGNFKIFKLRKCRFLLRGITVGPAEETTGTSNKGRAKPIICSSMDLEAECNEMQRNATQNVCNSWWIFNIFWHLLTQNIGHLT